MNKRLQQLIEMHGKRAGSLMYAEEVRRGTKDPDAALLISRDTNPAYAKSKLNKQVEINNEELNQRELDRTGLLGHQDYREEVKRREKRKTDRWAPQK